MIVALLLVFLTSPWNAYANDYVSKLQMHAVETIKSNTPNLLPDYKTDMPQEVSLNEHHSIEAATQHSFENSEVANHLKKTAENRPYFVVDPEYDPISKNSYKS
ncbi:MAG: hypothetical protein HOK20_05805, partial [Alphaproteobacteria bacterium]|nr:hypothetical protein [Alphaproteobacteria bacterium]